MSDLLVDLLLEGSRALAGPGGQVAMVVRVCDREWFAQFGEETCVLPITIDGVSAELPVIVADLVWMRLIVIGPPRVSAFDLTPFRCLNMPEA